VNVPPALTQVPPALVSTQVLSVAARHSSRSVQPVPAVVPSPE
jgi:hypothetical protein